MSRGWFYALRDPPGATMTGSSSAATGTMKPTGNIDFVSLPAVVD